MSSVSEIVKKHQKRRSKYKYDKFMTVKDRFGSNFRLPKPKESVSQYLSNAGYKDRDLEGHGSVEEFAEFKKVIDESPPIHTIAEIGFNAGHSADTFLKWTNAVMVSYDIMWHPYSIYSKFYIDDVYPGRHTLIAGDSTKTVLAHTILKPTIKYDLIFIDGNHLLDWVYADIVNMRQFAHPETILIIDDVVPQRGCGREVYDGWRKCMKKGIISHKKHVETDSYRSGFCVGWYVFNGKPHAGSILPNYNYIERRIAGWNLALEMEKAKSIAALNDIKRQLDILFKADGDYIDDYYKKRFVYLAHKLGARVTGGNARRSKKK
jgi:hypothetical protein